MSDKNEGSVLTQLFKTFFGKHWPVWVGGIVVGFLNVLLFAIKSPWGASGGINNWGENIFSSIGVFNLEHVTPTNLNLYGMLCLMIISGSCI